MTNTAILVEGRNFYAGWKRHAPYQEINFMLLKDLLLKETGGTHSECSIYYMGTDKNHQLSEAAHQRAEDAITLLLSGGFSVKEFPLRIKQIPCSKCGNRCEEIVEKQVDSAIAVDAMKLLDMPEVDQFVLVSSDSDQLPVIEAIKETGRKVWLVAWSDASLSHQMMDAVDGVIQLVDHSSKFLMPHGERLLEDPEARKHMLQELGRAERQFHGGYVGVNYFLTAWKSQNLPRVPAERSKLLSDLISGGFVQEYEARDGNRAIKRTPGIANEN